MSVSYFSQRSRFDLLHRNVAEDSCGPPSCGPFAALHNCNCRDTKSSSQELFGAAHHLSRLAGGDEKQTLDKSVRYNRRPKLAANAAALSRGGVSGALARPSSALPITLFGARDERLGPYDQEVP